MENKWCEKVSFTFLPNYFSLALISTLTEDKNVSIFFLTESGCLFIFCIPLNKAQSMITVLFPVLIYVCDKRHSPVTVHKL